jgi:hypothetical protein
MATVTCKCGAVKFEFPTSSTPRVHSLCGCDDCQRRVQYLADKGGTPMDTDHPIEVANFEGQMKFVKGRELLEFFKGKEETNMINVGSTCCHSFLCARNTDFHGTSIATLPQYATVKHADKPLEFLSFMKFWPNKQYKKNHEGLPEFWRKEDGGEGFDGTEGFMEAVGAAMAANAAPISEKVEGAITFEELVEGQTITMV